MRIELQPKAIVYFDGVCNLCNSAVQFILKQDKKQQFLFATLESDTGKNALEQVNKDGKRIDSVIIYYRGKYYTKSNAVLLTFKLLGGAWQLLYLLIILPEFFRNAVYDWIGKNRYKWFGKKNECALPSPEITKRFVNKELLK